MIATTRQHRREHSCWRAHPGQLRTYRAWMRQCGSGAGDELPSRRRALAVLAGLVAGALLGLATSIIHGMSGLALLAVCLCVAGAGALIAFAATGERDG